MQDVPSLRHVPCTGDRGANHTAPLPIWTARCSQNCRWYWRAVVSIRWKFSQHQSRRRGWRVWQHLHQFQSWLCWRLRRKTPKKVAAGRAGAAARRARQESLLAELHTAKEAINPRSEAVAEAATPVADVFVVKQQPMHATATHSVRHKVSNSEWTPWLLFGGAGLAALYVLGMPQQHPEAARSVSSGPVKLPRHLRVLSNYRWPTPSIWTNGYDVFLPDKQEYSEWHLPRRHCWWPGVRLCQDRSNGFLRAHAQTLLDTSWCWDGRLGPLRSYGTCLLNRGWSPLI